MNPTPNRNKLKRIIAPGAWEDADGNLHFSLPDLLEFMEMDDTPENRQVATNVIKDAMNEHAPQTTIIERATPEE